MLPHKSRSAASAAERPLLAPGWLIALLAAIVGLALFLLYPRTDLERRLAAMPDTALSAAYLTNLLRSDPNNPRLRLLLARQQLQMNKLNAARATLQTALDAGDEATRRAARWILFEITEADFRRLPPSADRSALQRDLLRQMEQLAELAPSVEQQIELAGKAYRYGAPDLGRSLFQTLARRLDDPAQASPLFEQAARNALANGDYRGCAELYLLARSSSRDAQQARRHFHAALRALQSGNQLAAALELGERELGDLADDPDTLLLLTEISRAAGRPDIADRYVRRLLKLSLRQQWQALQFARAWGDGAFQRVSEKGTPRGPGIAFDDRIFTLGYEVFLENRKLEDAWQVASAAVRQAPDDLAWRERLARVAEWTARPQVALDNWLQIARATGRDEAWQAVLRLAPGLFDDAALIPALHYQIARQPQDLRLIRELVAAHERLGDPRPAIAYLERLSQRPPRPEILELLAELAERAGETETALRAWQRLFADPAQITTARVLRAAVMLLLKGRGKEALVWLDKARPGAGLNNADDADYWRLSGQLADMQQRDAQAIDAFRRLVEADQAEKGDYDALIRLLNLTAPAEAAPIAARAWRQFDDPRYLIQALTLYTSRNRWQEIGMLLRELDPAPGASRRALHRLQTMPEFLRLAGTYQQNTGRLAEARRSFEAALRLAPDSADLQQALLWLFIDSNDAAALRRTLASHELTWRNNPALHDTLAASYQALSQPQVALQRYLDPRVAAHRDDFLWLMNYADALDQNQQSDRAWRLRRHLLSTEWQAARGEHPLHAARQRWLTEAGLDETRRLARARLLLTQRPGDAGLDALRELLRLDRGGHERYSNAAAETAIGWLQDRAEYSAERAFLWQQYARSRSSQANRPLWAEITVALAEQDKAATGHLLERFDERLPRYDRVNAARQVDDLRLAQSAAFETQSAQTDDDPTHQQLTETLLAFSHHAGIDVVQRNLGSIDERGSTSSLHVALTPRLQLDVEWGRLSRAVRDNNVLAAAPDEEVAGARLLWQQADGETQLRVERRESFDDYTPLQLSQRLRLDDRLSLDLAIGRHLPSQESIALRLAGMKEQQAIGLNYAPTRLDRIQLEHRREDYRLQNGEALGNGQHTSISYNHSLRLDTPDLQLGAFWSTHRFEREALSDSGQLARYYRDLLGTPQKDLYPGVTDLPANTFLPDSFRFYGLRLSSNLRYAQDYTRAWRPFGSLGITRHSALGTGYDLRLGLAGSLFGADHLALSGGLAKSGLQTGGQVRELQITYRIHY
ncbi:MAG: tetratricopeptide repeat protein [Azonexus sp.]